MELTYCMHYWIMVYERQNFFNWYVVNPDRYVFDPSVSLNTDHPNQANYVNNRPDAQNPEIVHRFVIDVRRHLQCIDRSGRGSCHNRLQNGCA